MQVASTPVVERTAPVDVITTWGYLVFNDGQQVPLSGKRVTVGRYPQDTGNASELNLNGMEQSNTISRNHAALDYNDGVPTLTDLNSTNFTFLNGTQLVPDRPLTIRNGDTVQFGKIYCTFKQV